MSVLDISTYSLPFLPNYCQTTSKNRGNPLHMESGKSTAYFKAKICKFVAKNRLARMARMARIP